ncbi:MAG: type II secretion system F family protein [Candidatus Pacearchaeota archaeon]
MKKKKFFGIIPALFVVAGSITLFGIKNPLTYFLIIIALILAILPFVIDLILSQNKQREKEEMFLAFSRDLVETVKSGTPVSKGIINLRNRNYGALSPHVSKLANQISLGRTLTEALQTFSRETGSKVIARAVSLISEAERSGGRIETIIESVALSVNQIDNLKKERKAAVSNLITQGYIIFIVFIIIMLVLEFKILPLVSDLSSGGTGLGVEVQKMDPEEFSMPLLVTILVQSFFSGLVIGKISEGNLKAGIKHSFILLALTLLVTTGAKVLFN